MGTPLSGSQRTVTVIRNQRPLKRGTIFKLAALAFLLLCGASLSFVLYSRLREKPRKTIAGWPTHVMTLAGDGSPGYSDGAGPQARFADPFGIALDDAGNVYVADAGDNNRIRKVTPGGQVTTLAGGEEGFKDGTGAEAAFNTPSAIAIDTSGNLYVADTGNNAIRKVTPSGVVTTLAGDGKAGYRDGPAREAEFNGPCGVAVDAQGNVFVADTYNDRIRQITHDGQVITIAGGDAPGFRDGAARDALFDTPCAVLAVDNNVLLIADTGNNLIRKLTPDAQVTTLAVNLSGSGNSGEVAGPMSLAQTHDRFLYITESRRGRIIELAPDGTAQVLAGSLHGFSNGDGASARFNSPAGIAVDRRGALYVADTANYLLRKLAPVESVKDMLAAAQSAARFEEQTTIPRLSTETLRIETLLWPIDPQKEWHEVTATLGEVRGNYDGESRDHLHSGVDVQGPHGETVHSIYDEKVRSPLSNWGLNELSEGIQVGVMTYIHMRVGRNQKDEPLDDKRFTMLRDEKGKPTRMRVRRGTRFRAGDILGTINRMYHIHLNFGPRGAEGNPLSLPFVEFSDRVAPAFEKDGIRLFDQKGDRLTEERAGRLLVRGDVKIVVEAYDQVDHNAARRRLGLYKLGYQVLQPDGTPAATFERPRIQLEFNRLPPEHEAVKIAYADSSGITVYGNATTRFLYVVTNTVRDGRAHSGTWHTSELPPGDYVLRIIAADFAGNEAVNGRDLPITIE